MENKNDYIKLRNVDEFDLNDRLPPDLRAEVYRKLNELSNENEFDREFINFIFRNHLDEIPGFIEHDVLELV